MRWKEFHVGENTQVGEYIINSRSPLSEPEYQKCMLRPIHVGEIHRVALVYTSVLPSVISGIVFVFSDFWFVQMTGRFTCRRIFNSRSPLYEPENTRFCEYPVFAHFGMCHWNGAPGDDVIIAYGVGTPYMYIYSLRHFLTTKGALIDGDGYPPKMPKNDPKNHSKITKIWSKLMSKNDQKWWFLMAKSSFSLNLITID